MTTMMTKRLTSSVELKAEAEGIVTAKFATLNVVDRHGDVILPGAIGEQSAVVSAWDHSTVIDGASPVGKAAVREDGDAAIADIQMFMSTAAGRDAFETVKALGDMARYSFGLVITGRENPSEAQKKAGARQLIKSLTVEEVSPVRRPAGIDTRTLAVKDEGTGLRCGECRHYLGESVEPLIFVGVKKQSSEVTLKAPRDLRYCGKCRVVNVFVPARQVAALNELVNR